MAAPTNPYELLQFNMIRAHDTFKLGYDIIMSLLANPPKDDLRNFLGYIQAWIVSIQEHHNSEETVVFPYLNQKMDFALEIEQHQAIHETIEKISGIVSTAQRDLSTFDPVQLSEVVTKFKEPLYSHLDEEVEHIAASKLQEAGFSEQSILTMIGELEKYAKSHGDPFLTVPFIRSHTLQEFKDIWPPMPWILRKIIVPYALAKRHAGYWKYAPYAMS